jgi:ABC-type amino acid transport substrate-binding protein
MKNLAKTLVATAALAVGIACHANAQSALDTIVQSKKLRCGIMLDSLPLDIATRTMSRRL